uniref:Zinc metalloproteinase n=1 Tax=Rhabditophanes sp. KR3021 TaxID=114890 RepID=A0AC35TGF5_9BILA
MVLPNFISLFILVNYLAVALMAGPVEDKIFSQNVQEKREAVDEIKEHFNVDSNNINKVTSLLDKIKKARYKKVYGKKAFSQDALLDSKKSLFISDAQPKTKPELCDILFEGDIYLSETQATTILNNILPRSRKSLTTDPEAFWKVMPIKYRFHESLTFFAISQIIEAVNYWQDNTCLSFKNIQQGIDGDYIEFFKGHGCYSMIGKFGGRQGISIGEGCERMGVVEHEIGHALGLWHQQSRPDALNYIKFDKTFILPSYLSDFEVRSTDEIDMHGIPYDLGSVMHYGSTAFSSDGSTRTLITLDPLYQMTIGQRDKLSFYDVKAINDVYCQGKLYKCEKRLIKCQNGGYIHPGKCGDSCICPSGYGGNGCEKNEASINGECGGVLEGSNYWKYIESPNYEENGYVEDQMCSWIIKVPRYKRVEVQFVDNFGFLCTSTCMDFVELKLQVDQKNTGPRFCCTDKPEETMVSEGNVMAVIFRSQIGSDVGFRMGFKVTGKRAKLNKSLERMETTERPTTISGFNVWSEWDSWSVCSKTCGACGFKTRNRSCKTSECHGRDQEFSTCNSEPCPNDPECENIARLKKSCKQGGDCQKLESCQSQLTCCPPFIKSGNTCISNDPTFKSINK